MVTGSLRRYLEALTNRPAIYTCIYIFLQESAGETKKGGSKEEKQAIEGRRVKYTGS